MQKRRWFCLLLVCLWAWACGAEVPGSSFIVDVWDADAGLPQNSVISMVRTRDGYLWLGTVNGLVRFDGLGRRVSSGFGFQFPVYDERNTPGLNSSTIVKLFEDSRGDLWIGTETAGVVRMHGARLESIDFGKGTREGRLLAICEDPSGAIWMHSADGQLGRYSNGKLEVWRSGADIPSRSRHLVVDDSGLLWVGTDRSLVALGPMTGTNTSAIALAYEVPIGQLDFLLESKSGGYWRLANGRIQKCNRDKVERDLGAYPWAWETPVYAACEDGNGNLVVGTGGSGVYWFDARGGYLQLTKTNGLSYNTILSLLSDNEGNLWVGTDGGGLDRVRPQVFKLFEPSSELVVRTVDEDSSGAIWVGYNMARMDYWKGQLTTYTNAQGLMDLLVRSVRASRSGAVWVGTLGRGVLRFANGVFLSAKDSPFSRRDREVDVLFEDSLGRIWAGGQEGLARFDNGRWQLFTMSDGLPANNIRCVAEDATTNIWVGFEGPGLAVLKRGEGIDTNAALNFPAGASVSSLLWDNGVLWAGTSLGLGRMANGKWTIYTNQFGLSSGNIGYMLKDSEGFLWLGSNLGLMRSPVSALNDFAEKGAGEIPVRLYGKADGLPTRECSRGSQPAALRSANGNLWFSTTKGLVTVNPQTLSRNTNPPPVIIEAVAVDGQMVTSEGLRARPPESLTVPAGKESLDIYFTSLNLSAPEQGRFRYQLEGFETTPTLVPGSTRSVHFSRLPQGHYRFHVTACNEDGVWNSEGSTISLRVLPPFWKTWWFLLLASLALLAIIIAIVHYISTQRLQQQLAVLRQHEALESERARIARDLHDQLGANLTQVALLGELAETDKDYPAEVESHARQISATARETTHALDEIVWTVNPSNDTLEGLCNYITKITQDYLENAGIKARLDVPAQLPATPISPELRHNVFLVAKEALNNVVKHSQATEARLRMSVEPDRFVMDIEDNGKGLPSNAHEKGRNGLKNMRRRIEEVGGSFKLTTPESGGTRICIEAPVRQQH